MESRTAKLAGKGLLGLAAGVLLVFGFRNTGN